MELYQCKMNYVLKNYHSLLWRNPNVVGVGIGNKIIDGYITNIPSIMVFVERKLFKSLINKYLMIPGSIDGILTDVIGIGTNEIIENNPRNNINFPSGYKLVTNERQTRPAVGGIGIGSTKHKGVGTLGYAVTDKITNKNLYILSCNHVLSQFYNGNKGDMILQPAQSQGGKYPKDYIGTLVKWIPMKLGPIEKEEDYNEADAAIALVNDNTPDNQKKYLMPKLKDGTIIGGISDVSLSNTVYKIGFGTNKTEGLVLSITTKLKTNSTLDDKTTRIDFKNMIITDIKTASGDSGSLVIKKDTNMAIGLHCGSFSCEETTGSGNFKRLSYCSPISRVFDLLNLELAKPL